MGVVPMLSLLHPLPAARRLKSFVYALERLIVVIVELVIFIYRLGIIGLEPALSLSRRASGNLGGQAKIAGTGQVSRWGSTGTGP